MPLALRGGSPPSGSRRAVVAVLLLTVVAAAVGAVGAVLWAGGRDQQRVATAVVLLHPLEGNAFSPVGRGDELVNLETEAQLVRSDAVATMVLEDLGLEGEPATVLDDVSVAVLPNTQLLEISVEHPDADTAVERTDAFASAFLAYRQSRSESAVFEQTARFEELIRKREDERDLALDRLADAPDGSTGATVAQQQVEEFTVEISSLRAQLAAVQAASRDPGQLVTPGAVESPGVLESPAVLALAGALAAGGAALVLGLAAIRGGRDPERVPLVTVPPEIPVLGRLVPPARSDSEAVASVRSTVLSGTAQRPLLVLCGTAEDADESTLFPLVTEAFAKARYEVIAIDATVAAHADALGELLSEESGPDDVLVEYGSCLLEPEPVHGPRPARRDELPDLAASAGMVRVLGELGKRADIVLIHPGSLLSPLARALVVCVDAVVVEAPAGATTTEGLTELAGLVERSRARLAGLVHVVPPASAWRPRIAHRLAGGPRD